MNLKILEVSENINDSSISRNIYDCNKIARKLVTQSEWLEEIGKDDFEYIAIITEKARMLLYKAYCIFKTYTDIE